MGDPCRYDRREASEVDGDRHEEAAVAAVGQDQAVGDWIGKVGLGASADEAERQFEINVMR